ncbi:ABC transporter ATP-binding protein [Cellulomonas sp. ATA003]|uniref:ABC transporter ATP-binding protein n=1 Tax=Cellulomonas sp. ATA003 TaxID=3073064 RepID=UPI002872FF91|nr:ABC transporter ATP-binding protein [Cellulomonas sp. ATA003]WNB86397.1 ABC transporter ATP-binding protein [Cellulomonas sp. ATA003]
MSGPTTPVPTTRRSAGGPAGRSAGPAGGGGDRTIEISHLSKTFGAVRAVDDLSFTVQPGRVTGFLGPNGAGKTTTLRMLLGLVRPTSGTATIGGRTYADLDRPMHRVGAALEAASFHPGRSALDHLRVYAPQAGVPDSRCHEVLALVGLDGVAKRRVSGFSLGMRQRLALATTLLGDPGVLLLDEPANGLDPEGIAWLRAFLRHLAGEGRTVLVSSHVLSEVEQTVDDVVIIARGRLVHASSLPELAALAEPTVRVTSPDTAGLHALVAAADWGPNVEPVPDARPGTLVLRQVRAAEVGARAFSAGLELHELATREVGLEGIFLRLVDGGGPPPREQTETTTQTITPTTTQDGDA